ncbi:translation initiation factor IF-3 [Candidatus Purcelliella pentastirinorum]|uniref:translation initiation factor IF-3 n=1 Tax=Candidatus Purcelliella pentastirinorum TaxID=472834 RepID=UPI00236893E4|nr:translation initiation factor IF-3 [Candidatus Purcelliella pentastirinorum]WDI78881.1 translation initiation factor IF-3 [Candidatus Purcelliella pentastirinorum]WDR80015.1 translation initiation factor IF-3 [Candidatus Purcelliella pentastirinorum]
MILKKMYSMISNKINREINVDKVRLIGVNGEKIGIVTLNDALFMAEKAGVDLVEINANTNPHVCRIIDYGKLIYERGKSLKNNKKKQKVIQTKEVKFRPATDKGDYNVKLRNLLRFLLNGCRVKVTLRFRGREISHQQLGIDMLNRIKLDLMDCANVESFPLKIEGRQMIMLLIPKKK